jgi:polar amino acid transport system substrate-binding protein
MSMKQSRAALLAATFAAFALLASGCAAAGGGSAGSGGNAGSKLGLVTDGDLTVCVNLDSPPNVYAKPDGTPIGVEVDIAKSMAKEMKLTVQWKELSFAGLIPALQARQCDTIISSLYIKPEREKIASFVPYLYSGTGIGVAKSNPKRITGVDESLCGKKVIAITGATGAALVEAQAQKCTSEGKAAISSTLTDKAADGLQQVIAGQQDAYVDAAESVNYLAQQSKGQFTVIGDPIDKIKIGAASLKTNKPLHDALQSAFETIQKDGTYAKILKKWSFESLDIAKS